ncbi:Hrp65 protein [Sarcoptes scabiei]|nr:Hrp65 protein [Sarcoptes scabiei]
MHLKMFSTKKYSRYLEDQFDRQYYGARLKLKKFDTDEFQSLHSKIYPPFIDSSQEAHLVSCVEVRDLSFHYNPFNPILKSITIDVPRGKIYALLGASGCGKTTLLRMILGTLKPMSGTIKVFNETPGTKESNVPGSGVGYMPQDLALFMSFTVKETLTFYGHLYGMPIDMINYRIDHLVDLLNLPKKNRLVSQLSGGQQRRVSLAVTMIHMPPLLILDEPTVGVDSLLRLRIWNYLEDICRDRGTTVIITTHYTEEARNSFRVGFIDSGVVLAEDNPQRLLYKYNCDSLEDVFLELCLEKAKSNNIEIENEEKKNSNQIDGQEINNTFNCKSIKEKNQMKLQNQIIIEEDTDRDDLVNNGDIKSDPNNNNNNNTDRCKIDDDGDQYSKSKKLSIEKIDDFESKLKLKQQQFSSPISMGFRAANNHHYLNTRRITALLEKNFILFKRNPSSIILLNLIPVLQMTLFCITFNRNPENIPIAVVNDENRTHSLSNLFIENIDSKALKIKPYSNVEDAIKSVQTLHTHSVLTFQANFSRNFRRRFLKPESVTDKVIESSKIGFYPDTTHAVFHLYIYQHILEAFERFIKAIGVSMGYNPKYFGSPVDLMEPIYGRMDLKYFEFVAPGMIIALVHGMSMLMGSFSVVSERHSGYLERGMVAGIKASEILLSHLIFFIVPVFTQVVLCLFLTFYIFGNHSVGSLWEIFFITFITSVQGLVFGLTLSVICPTELASLLAVFILEAPFIFTSGVLWPLSSLPESVQKACLWNPITLPIQSTHYIMFRGWTLANIQVLFGLGTCLAYISIVLSIGFITFEIFK